jgi:2'-5' RNA ligase superfamily
MPEPGTTAVLAILPAADPLLTLAASIDPLAVRPGIPAHATLLYPWIPADRIDAGRLTRLRTALAPFQRIPVTLSTVERSPGFVNIPVPELEPLAAAARSAFPDQIPYGGRFGPNPPVHLTIALDTAPDTAARITELITPRLPLTTTVDTVHAVTLTATGWHPAAEISLFHR